MTEPGSDQGTLVVQLAQWGTMMEIDEAMSVVFADDFDPDTADHRDLAIAKLLTYGETLGTMTKHGLLSEELVLDWIWIAGLWSRVGAAALRARELMGEPRLYENFEALAGRG